MWRCPELKQSNLFILHLIYYSHKSCEWLQVRICKILKKIYFSPFNFNCWCLRRQNHCFTKTIDELVRDQTVSMWDFGSSFHYCVIKNVTADVLLHNKMKWKGFAKQAGGKS